MAGLVHKISQAVQKFWSVIYGKSAPAAAEVMVHDPAAQRAHDLDDPYFDDKVQTRMADVIAGAQKK